MLYTNSPLELYYTIKRPINKGQKNAESLIACRRERPEILILSEPFLDGTKALFHYCVSNTHLASLNCLVIPSRLRFEIWQNLSNQSSSFYKAPRFAKIN